MQSKDFTDINSESVGQMELEWLPLPCRILLHERSAAENVLDTAISPALARRKAPRDLVWLRDRNTLQGHAGR